MIWIFDAWVFDVILAIFGFTIYFVQNNIRYSRILKVSVLLLCFFTLSCIYRNEISCECEKGVLKEIYNCIREDVPKEKILKQLDLCLENQDPYENHKIFAMKVRMCLSSLYSNQQKETEASLEERSLKFPETLTD